MEPENRPIREMRFAAIDFESAGASKGSTDTPIQIGIAVMEGGEILPTSLFRSYLRAQSPIVWQARKVHGISEADISDAPTLLSLWPEVRERLGESWVLAHGAGTERRFLRAFPLHGFAPWLDTLKIARALFPAMETYELSALAKHFGLEKDISSLCPGLRWHDALFDAVASLVLFRHFLEIGNLWSAPADLLLSPALDSYYRNQALKKATPKSPDQL